MVRIQDVDVLAFEGFSFLFIQRSRKRKKCYFVIYLLFEWILLS